MIMQRNEKINLQKRKTKGKAKKFEGDRKMMEIKE